MHPRGRGAGSEKPCLPSPGGREGMGEGPGVRGSRYRPPRHQPFGSSVHPSSREPVGRTGTAAAPRHRPLGSIVHPSSPQRAAKALQAWKNRSPRPLPETRGSAGSRGPAAVAHGALSRAPRRRRAAILRINEDGIIRRLLFAMPRNGGHHGRPACIAKSMVPRRQEGPSASLFMSPGDSAPGGTRCPGSEKRPRKHRGVRP
jgi:hypothetical protein